MQTSENQQNSVLIKSKEREKDWRHEFDNPAVIRDFGWQYHHIGIPTSEKRKNERYIPHLKMYVSGFHTSPFGIEWMRFEEDSPVHEMVKKVPHVAFRVDSLDDALQGRTLLSPASSPMDGVRVAMIIHDDAPVELLEIEKRV